MCTRLRKRWSGKNEQVKEEQKGEKQEREEGTHHAGIHFIHQYIFEALVHMLRFSMKYSRSYFDLLCSRRKLVELFIVECGDLRHSLDCKAAIRLYTKRILELGLLPPQGITTAAYEQLAVIRSYSCDQGKPANIDTQAFASIDGFMSPSVDPTRGSSVSNTSQPSTIIRKSK